MKITFDRIRPPARYPVNLREIKTVFRLIPEDWKPILLNTVHISNQHSSKTRFDRPVIHDPLNSTLNVVVMGLPKRTILEEILVELYAKTKGIDTHYGNVLDKSQRKMILSKIADYREIIWKAWADALTPPDAI